MRTKSLLSLLALSAVLVQGCKKDGFAPKEVTPQITAKKASDAFGAASIFQDNMVLQRDKPLNIWGTGTNGHTITVKASWDGTTYSATVANNAWSVTLAATTFKNTAQNVVIKDNGASAITLNNVLVGDVWLCSGQSNMVMPLNKQDDNFGGFHGVYNYQSEIAAANYPNIKMMVIPGALNTAQQDNLSSVGTWMTCNPTNAALSNFSATAYYFARKVKTSLSSDVPIGVVVSAFSGSYCEEWCSASTISRNATTNSYYAGRNSSSQLYNAMIYPLRNLSMKGIIWYQGESNTSDVPVSNYTILNSNMIADWRTLFNQGTLPFYYVQLAPLGTLFADTSQFTTALFRQAQTNVRSGVAHTGMACIMDTNDPFNIHNIYKQPVGERLALLALKNDYAKTVTEVGPQLASWSQSSPGADVVLTFNNATGLTANGKTDPQYFYVASASDQKFWRASNVVISGNTVHLTVPFLGMPVAAVRYAFTNGPVTHFSNSAGLPMEPFRTDNW